MNNKIKAGIVGATGYAGAELVRLLFAHPEAEVAAISSVSFEGQKLSDVYPSYSFLNDMICENQDAVAEKSDVIFAALPHGLSQELAEKCISAGKAFIDLGADFRLESEEEYTEWYGGTFLDKALHEQSVYGLPEFFRENIKGKKLIANPGCYTTCSPLAIAPAIAKGLISTKGIICDCKSGVTGAGRKPTQGSHFPELNEGFHAYKVASHRHTPEIEQTLSKLSGEDVKITFVPHLLPVNRGILATVYADIKDGVTFEEIRAAYEDYYKDEFFVRLLEDGKCADIHNVRYSNFCDISLHHDKRVGKLVACAAIDNMVKGSGDSEYEHHLRSGRKDRSGARSARILNRGKSYELYIYRKRLRHHSARLCRGRHSGRCEGVYKRNAGGDEKRAAPSRERKARPRTDLLRKALRGCRDFHKEPRQVRYDLRHSEAP